MDDSTIDFNYQFSLIRDKVERRISTLLCDISRNLHKERKNAGTIIVLGNFYSQAKGMRSFGKYKVEKYLNVLFPTNEQEIIKMFESGEDGAIIINHSGEVLATNMYLIVDNPNLEIPEGTGTRHISAASFSQRPDVLSTFTLSEETLSVRMWRKGVVVELFHPDDEVLEN